MQQQHDGDQREFVQDSVNGEGDAAGHEEQGIERDSAAGHRNTS